MTIATLQPLDHFAYDRDSDGCDDLWVIHCPNQQRDIARIAFWDCSPEWMQRTEADARLLSSAPVLYNAVKEFLVAVKSLPSQALSIEVLQAEQSAIRALAWVEGGSHA
jgi:hypothetical protein